MGLENEKPRSIGHRGGQIKRFLLKGDNGMASPTKRFKKEPTDRLNGNTLTLL